MSTQTTISQFFTSRKRAATEELKRGLRNKVLKIEDTEDYKCCEKKIVINETIQSNFEATPTSPHYNPKKTPQFNTLRQVVKCVRSQSAEKVKKRLFESRENCEEKDAVEEGNVKNEKTAGLRTEDVSSNQTGTSNEDELISKVLDKKEVKKEKASLKQKDPEESKPLESDKGKQEEKTSIKEEQKKETPQDPLPSSSVKDHSTLERCSNLIKDSKSSLKKKLTRSGRLAEIKQKLGSINDKISNLSIPKNQEPEVPPSPSKTLDRFDSLQVEVERSPLKSASLAMREADAMVAAAPGNCPSLRQNLFKSPAKPTISQLPVYTSPRKLMVQGAREGTAIQDHDRYSALACGTGRTTLPLPLAYRTLGELFRAVDAVSAMVAARNDTITFASLKPSVERITCKTLTENHLGQMLTVMPDAFTLVYKGSGSKKQLLLIPPVGEGGVLLAPATQLERKRAFYNKLISITRDYHQHFLEQLDPPLIVEKEKVTRWHPHFDIHGVPPIEVSKLLPECPSPSSAPTATAILKGAREMLFANERMRSALGRLDSLHASEPQQKQNSAAAAVPALTNALARIPRSLLEKIRAKEAARTAEMLVQPPEARQLALRVTRLPALSRIVRNLFIAERKNVLDRPHVLDKIVSSYPDTLTTKELDAHLSLMIEKAPKWLSVSKFDNIEYIRMDKTVDINKLDFS